VLCVEAITPSSRSDALRCEQYHDLLYAVCKSGSAWAQASGPHERRR
jgi:hypothetical protein